MPPLVAIIGRPNVGKSTLFNRLIQNRRALVDGQPGVTRDRLYSALEYQDRAILFADTGGLDLEDTENIVSGIRDQAIVALNEATLVAFVVDVRTGMNAADEEIAAYLRKYDKPIILVLNKVDTRKQAPLLAEFSKLGFDQMVATSAEHDVGMGELLTAIVDNLPEDYVEVDENEEVRKISIIGRPNVGKSSILNAIIGDKRMIVSEVAGTTRDVIDVGIRIDGKSFIFLDTAGIRKKAAITKRMEAISSIKARQTIGRADCCILVVNAEDGVTSQDKALAGMIDKESAGALVALNKWDIVQKRFETGEEGDKFIKDIQKDLKFMSYAPVISTCALSGMRVPKLITMLSTIAEKQKTIIPANELSSFLDELQRHHPAPHYKGRSTEIFKIAHLMSAPARFRIFVRGFIPGNYLRYMERSIREEFNFEGIPMHFTIVRV